MRTLVLEIKYGGLGDHLFYSHIPRIAKENGYYDAVYISSLSEFRHPAYKHLIWELNPFVDGFIDEPGSYFYFDKINKGMNILDHHMVLLGMDDGKRYHEPEIYYAPNVLSELKEKIIYDPNYVSGVGQIGNSAGIKRWFKKNNVIVDFEMDEREKNYGIKHANKLYATSIYHYCDMICSCKEFYCLTSGSATLAAALNKKATAFFGPGQYKMFHHSLLHQYVEVYADYSMPARIKRIIKKIIRYK